MDSVALAHDTELAPLMLRPESKPTSCSWRASNPEQTAALTILRPRYAGFCEPSGMLSSPEFQNVLERHILPLLPPKDLGKLLMVNKPLKIAVSSCSSGVWQRAAQALLPAQHPINTCPSETTACQAALQSAHTIATNIESGQCYSKSWADRGVGRWVHAVGYSPDGQLVAAVGKDRLSVKHDSVSWQHFDLDRNWCMLQWHSTAHSSDEHLPSTWQLTLGDDQGKVQTGSVMLVDGKLEWLEIATYKLAVWDQSKPHISPDGLRVVFWTCPDRAAELHFLNVVTGAVAVFHVPDWRSPELSWLPDSSSVLVSLDVQDSTESDDEFDLMVQAYTTGITIKHLARCIAKIDVSGALIWSRWVDLVPTTFGPVSPSASHLLQTRSIEHWTSMCSLPVEDGCTPCAQFDRHTTQRASSWMGLVSR